MQQEEWGQSGGKMQLTGELFLSVSVSTVQVISRVFPVVQWYLPKQKTLETQVQYLGQENPLE